MEGGAPSSILLLLSAMQSVYRRLGAQKMSARSVRHWELFVSIAAIFPSHLTPRPAPLPLEAERRSNQKSGGSEPCKPRSKNVGFGLGVAGIEVLKEFFVTGEHGDLQI